MSRPLFYALIVPLIAAEIWAQFVAHDPRWTTLFALLAGAVLAVYYALGPRTDAEGCLPDCPKCRESRGDL
ncbi:hypothetical protein [Streptomyces sp. WAC06128]|uniref:hypothetical protein n=1 Tax=Streptomyces sp. WAC06128 TaxID=2487426 RepID=UPI000F98723B|nr:hypothetical protein [Streptomyces sp. WAC06128]RSS67363.1 hypothetical protein EF911_35995 [Streptomyces sp. WAC06128]